MSRTGRFLYFLLYKLGELELDHEDIERRILLQRSLLNIDKMRSYQLLLYGKRVWSVGE